MYLANSGVHLLYQHVLIWTTVPIHPALLLFFRQDQFHGMLDCIGNICLRMYHACVNEFPGFIETGHGSHSHRFCFQHVDLINVSFDMSSVNALTLLSDHLSCQFLSTFAQRAIVIPHVSLVAVPPVLSQISWVLEELNSRR